MEERARMERVISRKAQRSIPPDKKLGLQGLYTMMAPLVRGLRTSNTGRSRKKYYGSSRKRMEDPHVNYKGEMTQKLVDSNREGRRRLLKLLRGGIVLCGCVAMDSGSSFLVVKGLQGMYSAGCFDGSSYNRVRWQALGKGALLMGVGLTDFCISGGTLTSEAAGTDGGISSEDGDVGNATDVGGARDGSVLRAAWSTITFGALAGSIFSKNAAQFWRAGRTSTSHIREYLRGFRIPVAAQPNPSRGAKDGARVNLYFLRLDGNGGVESLNSVRGPGVRFVAKSAVGRQPLEPFSHHDAPKEAKDEQENLNCSTNSVILNGMLGVKKLASAAVDASRKAVGNIPLVEKIVDGVKQGSAKVAEKVKSGVQEDSLVKKAVAAVRNGTNNVGPSLQEAVEGFKQRLGPAFEKCRDYTKSSSLKETAAAVASNPFAKIGVKVFVWKMLRTDEAPLFELFLQEESSGDCAAQVGSETSGHGQDSGDPVTETPEGDNSAGKDDPNRKC